MCRKVFHGAFMQANLFETWKIQGPCMEKFCKTYKQCCISEHQINSMDTNVSFVDNNSELTFDDVDVDTRNLEMWVQLLRWVSVLTASVGITGNILTYVTASRLNTALSGMVS